MDHLNEQNWVANSTDDFKKCMQHGSTMVEVHVLDMMNAITWFDNKLVLLISTMTNPIDDEDIMYLLKLHGDGPIKIPTSLIFIYY